MIKLSVFYPYVPGARFDHDYFRDHHLPLVKRLMGDACKFYTIDKGISGANPDTPPTYVAISHIYAESIEIFNAGASSSNQQILDDIQNYTDISAVLQFSDIVVS